MPANQKPHDKPAASDPAGTSSAEERRIRARRRFLHLGAKGSAALVVTVTHKRAFANIKKNVVASNCTSLQGVPDLKNAHQKKALQTSAMGTPKGLMCRPRDETPPVCPTYSSDKAKYYQFANDGGQPFYIKSNKFKNGCGTIEKTVQTSYNYRLYEKGYCPLVYDQHGLRYDLSATYFKKDGGQFILTQCKVD